MHTKCIHPAEQKPSHQHAYTEERDRESPNQLQQPSWLAAAGAHVLIHRFPLAPLEAEGDQRRIPPSVHCHPRMIMAREN